MLWGMGFRLGRIPVRIHGSFLITTLLLSTVGGASFANALIWLAVVFFSVIMHELGHAVAGRLFGLEPQIDLHGMGGTTSWVRGRKLSSLQSIVVSLAGPFLGIALGVGFFAFGTIRGWDSFTPLAKLALYNLVWVNGFWGALNLLPMLPLDGGNVMAVLANVLTKGNGERPARIISIVIALAAAPLAFKYNLIWAGALSLLFAFRNFQALRAVATVQEEVGLVETLTQAQTALDAQDGREAIRLAEAAYADARSPQVRFEALRILAYGRVLEGHWGPLMSMLERTGRELGPQELERLQSAALELGRPDEAARIGALLSAFQAESESFRA